MAILPELAVDLKNVEIEIGLFNTTSNYGAISLGVMDNTWDSLSYKEVAYFQTVTKPASTGTYTPTQLEVFSKMMNTYQGTGKVLAIKNATANSIGIKYVKLTELPDCVKPQQVEVTLVTDKAATINWIAGLEEAWEIKVNDSIIENVTTNPYRIQNLEQGTVYSVSVRAICDAQHTSEWALPTTFQTTCGVNVLPMSEDFSNLTQPIGTADLRRATLTCWDNMVSANNIDQVFNGTDAPFTPASSVYVGDSWVSNWISALGEYKQLHSYRRDDPTYRYKWFVSPQYAIEGDATLSFDIRVCNNVGNGAKNSDRTYVAITTDNGATWKRENATLLTDLDSVYRTKSISLNKYAGQNIRIAFYDENVSSSHKLGEQPFLLIDNVRMNCAETYPEVDNTCEGNDYEGFGFSIKKEDLPLVGKDSTYTRFAQNTGEGCDSIISLTLTTHAKPDAVIIDTTICRGEVYVFGGQNLTEPNPAGQPYYLSDKSVFGCDSVVYLNLSVRPADTLDITAPKTLELSELPFTFDDGYVVPAGTAVGDYSEIVKIDGCNYNRYIFSVEDTGTGFINVTDDIDFIEIFDALGRKVMTITEARGNYQLHLPMGVYMVRATMLSGKTENSKLLIK